MSQENWVIQKLTELWVEMKYMSQAIIKMEKIFEQFSGLLEKQSVANKRILSLEQDQSETRDRILIIENQELKIVSLEEDQKACKEKVRKLEDWQLKIVSIATVIATIVWFLLNKLF